MPATPYASGGAISGGPALVHAACSLPLDSFLRAQPSRARRRPRDFRPGGSQRVLHDAIAPLGCERRASAAIAVCRASQRPPKSRGYSGPSWKEDPPCTRSSSSRPMPARPGPDWATRSPSCRRISTPRPRACSTSFVSSTSGAAGATASVPVPTGSGTLRARGSTWAQRGSGSASRAPWKRCRC